MKINPRKNEHDEAIKGLVERVISELPENFVVGVGEATAHFSQADGGTIKIYPSRHIFSYIYGVRIPGREKEALSEKRPSISFEYKGRKFFITYD
jgi:hypothetical protein